MMATRALFFTLGLLYVVAATITYCLPTEPQIFDHKAICLGAVALGLSLAVLSFFISRRAEERLKSGHGVFFMIIGATMLIAWKASLLFGDPKVVSLSTAFTSALSIFAGLLTCMRGGRSQT